VVVEVQQRQQQVSGAHRITAVAATGEWWSSKYSSDTRKWVVLDKAHQWQQLSLEMWTNQDT